MAATQEALYGRLDMALSWSEADLPERERTKHVHRLHPYLGKFVPQLVEALLERYVVPGGHVLDPFAGSGTTLVQALESGRDGLESVATILREARSFLRPQGLLVVEVGNTERVLARAYPKVPFTWLDFERGGGGVFLLTREQLEKARV